MKLATINFIWIGNQLGEVHAACVRSFVRHGHKVLMHCYEEIIDLPKGVEVHDANKLLPISEMIRMRNGSPAVFCDLLRYEVQAQGLGLYVDCDVYCLKPIENEEYMVGWESDKFINQAVLKLPLNSPTLKDLLRLKNKKTFIPPWLKKKHQYKYRLRACFGFPAKLEDLPWGTTGPKAVTYYLKRNGEEDFAQPIDIYYSLSSSHLSLLLDPSLNDIESVVTPRTQMIHLWNGGNLNKLIKQHGIPEGSILYELLSN